MNDYPDEQSVFQLRSLTVWQGYVDAFLKSPPQCLVDIPGMVGSSQHNDQLGCVLTAEGSTNTCTQRQIKQTM